MTDTIRELILRVLDYVEKMPGAYFEIARWDKGIRGPDKNQMHFMFFYTKGDNPIHFISRDDDKYWSYIADLDEDNLQYLVEQLEGEGK